MSILESLCWGSFYLVTTLSLTFLSLVIVFSIMQLLTGGYNKWILLRNAQKQLRRSNILLEQACNIKEQQIEAKKREMELVKELYDEENRPLYCNEKEPITRINPTAEKN